MGAVDLRAPGHLYKRGRVWWCWYFAGAGVRHRVSTKCTDRRAALQVLRTLERDASSGTRKAEPHSVGEALQYLIDHGMGDLAPASADYYGAKALVLARHLGGIDVNGLTLDQVQEFVDARSAEQNGNRKHTVTAHTVAKELVTLRKALRLAKDRGKLQLEPAALIPRWRPRYAPKDRHLTRGEYLKLRAVLPEERGLDPKTGKRVALGRDRRQLWLDVACYTGLRDKELLELEWGWFDLKGGWLKVVGGSKTDRSKNRMIPIHPSLLATLRGRRGAGRVFPAWPSRRRDLKAACDRTGVPDVTPNDLRRTFASWLKERGVDSAVVAKLLGHATSAMVERVYGHLSNSTLQEAVLALPGRARESQMRHSEPG